MARIPRVVVPNAAHHVTQRGNRRQKTFFCDDDYRLYLALLSEACKKSATEIWAYCLMPNHVHLVLVPKDEDGLRKPLSAVHRQYSRHINFRQQWRGHLWQERFHSFPMNDQYLLSTVHHVELNPVKARIVATAEEWPWSSARAHLAGVDTPLVSVGPMLEMVDDWRTYLASSPAAADEELVQKHTRTGRPLGDAAFVAQIEQKTGRDLKCKKPGPKPNREVGVDAKQQEVWLE